MSDATFGGSVAEFYERYMVPMIFAPYAEVMARGLPPRTSGSVLETAAGTGVVTRQLAALLPREVSIVATDLSQPMLNLAASIGTSRPVRWKQADATELPFSNATFDAVVCQFGAMFFSKKVAAFAEARRVLRPGGVFRFSVWDRIEENEFVHVVNGAVGRLFPGDPPPFAERTPHGYYEWRAITKDLELAGFRDVKFETVARTSKAESARAAAIAYCQGTPLRGEIESRGMRVEEATDAAERALVERFGAGPIEGEIRAHIVVTEAPIAATKG